MANVVVGMADCQVSKARDSVLVTYALGSCIAVAIHDPVAGVGGLLHYMLPEASISPAKAGENPYMFADTGIPLLFRRAYEYGAEKRRLVVRVAGGAQVMDQEGIFNIGKRNYLALRKIFWKAGVLVQGEDVGGNLSRTVRLEVGSGRFWLRGSGSPEQELPLSSAAAKGVQPWPSAS
ncbi:MAG TPA: chemotaxis protein CheD [Bryobacteraceae bacterium]|nr:chemotaxis protein CheD [Bryobacteraceae bacterium]